MIRKEIEAKELTVRADDLWSRQWLVLAAGDFAAGTFNAMTVAWGSLGTMWHKPFAQIVVRPSRYTSEFLERHGEFTLSVLPREYKKSLQLLGSVSGRERDKIAEAGLTPCAAEKVGAPVFQEAELVLECRVLYKDMMRPEAFVDQGVRRNYPEGDYHRIYFGEILRAAGIDSYRPR